ncbi:MAG: peptidoglycan bridge formation glycyltransferase FemA/FemB family protein [Anaerolineales bacterium]|nr:peptidoglycan bridge formation glycyltransferase FemA/FemB family protein [Anaerolineales bacterium]
MPEIDNNEWNLFLNDHPESHLLQSSAWGELKANFGWRATYIQTGQAGSMVLFRQLPMDLTIAYIPKGPVGIITEDFWKEVDDLCIKKKSILLKVEPDDTRESPFPLPSTFRPSPQSVQPPRSSIIEIVGEEEDILANMKQKTRYNIRLAIKKDVIVRKTNDIAAFSSMMEITGNRDDFGVHDEKYYQMAYDLFHPSGKCELLIAYYQDIPLAGLMLFLNGNRSWYFYGASTNEERNRMPTYLLQWEAILTAKAAGCVEYDLWGIPDVEPEQLEAEFQSRSDGLWGVYRFKRGFNGTITRSSGTWDKVYRPILYTLYKIALRVR